MDFRKKRKTLGKSPIPQDVFVLFLMPKVTWCLGSWVGIPLGQANDLAQEKTAAYEVVKDHHNEGPVENDNEKLERQL